MFGAIEAGGTKFVCAVGQDIHNIVDQLTIPTTAPEETMPQVIEFFKKYEDSLKAMGIASFGPIDINEKSETYGYITNTPKMKWRHTDFLGWLKKEFPNVKLTWTTDVNGSAYGEYTVREDVENLVYYTIGTGVGGGAVINGQLLQQKSHPEMGHVSVRKQHDDTFEGVCPSHGDCLEGLVSGPAVEARMGMPSKEIPEDDNYWDLQAHYIAQSMLNTNLIMVPEVIILGGGVMKVPGLIEKIRKEFIKLNRGYAPIDSIDEYLVLPQLGDFAAVVGCIAMAQDSLTK